jgi:Family of unknown function (DUF6127)
MTPSHHGGSAARLSDADLEVMLARAAEEGARRALSDVRLGGKDAVLTNHDVRSLGISSKRTKYAATSRRRSPAR